MDSERKVSVITIKILVCAPLERVWLYWNEPEHIKKWSFASEDWHTTASQNDLKVGGRFLSRMEAKDGSFGFDFSGTYTEVKEFKEISYTLDDNRKVSIYFSRIGNNTEVMESFEAEATNSLELQKQGWQAILNHFKQYVEKEMSTPII